MIRSLKDFFEGKATLAMDKEGRPTNEDLRIATGIILLEMAGVDRDYAESEVNALFNSMKEQFDLGEMETFELLEMADGLRKTKASINDFITLINRNFDEEQRQLILAMLWKVVLADEKIDEFEESFSSQIRLRLKLNDEMAKEARLKAERREV